MTTIIPFSLSIGLLLSVALSALILASIYFNSELWVSDYPPDIRDQYGPMSPRSRRQRWLVAIPFFVVPVLILAASINRIAGQTELSFWLVFWHSFLALSMFNVVDLIVLDWLIFVWIQPKFVVLPGTAGMAGYRDYWFHFRGFVAGMLLITVFSAAAAGASLGLQWLGRMAA